LGQKYRIWLPDRPQVLGGAHAIDNSWREGEVDWDMAKATAEMYLDDKDMGNQIIDSYPIDITENE
jgi:hypothetical protein